MSQNIAARFAAPGPKRMLALDGGGTRGIITIAFLQQIQATLQVRLGRGDDFVLADYFDMIGGTSVGSILATLLALGWRTERIEQTFTEWAPHVFKRRTSVNDRYDARALSSKIHSVVKSWPMRSDQLLTGLCIVAKRADTNSPWVLTNNPAGRYFEGAGGTIANGDYLIHDVIRASTAAPTLFSPKKIEIDAWYQGGKRFGTEGYFMDGALSPYNNPAWLMFLLASLKAHNLGGTPVAALKADRANGRAWPLGPDKLLLISIGTGSHGLEVRPQTFRVFEAVAALRSMIHDSEQLALAQLQALSQPRLSWTIDSEIGDLSVEQIAGNPLLSFQRYDMPLEARWLGGDETSSVKRGPELAETIARLNLKVETRLPRLRELVNVPEMKTLATLAKAAAQDQVSELDFPAAFNEMWQPATSSPEAA